MSITSTPRHFADGKLRAATGAWDPVEFHQSAGTRIAIARRGQGPTVVCLHATGHGGRDFEPFAERVGAGFEVVAVDWPGQGRSPREQSPASAARYSQILEDLLPSIAEGPAILVGCSIGGAAAIELAARRPDLVRALVLCDPGGLVAVDAATRFAIGRFRAFFEAGARGASWFPVAFALYYRIVLPQPAARPQRDRIVAASRETAPVLAEAWASFADPAADLRGLVPAISCPVLLAWASQDRIIPWSRSKAAAGKFPDFRVEFFRAGHAAFLEDPDRFAEVFRGFATALTSGPAAAAATGSWKAVGSA
jgi:4,5:9,10-diseco-3-hydroxy-5,9,17-trioxoandrosta-1(10),2-diene-4-oate hydrolase